jgi:membrane protease subunit (stomatin/prohibitin family)
MGLARFVNKQFIDVIDWTEDGDDVLAWRFPTADLEIQQGAALIVRETQTAIFVDEGRLADRFEAGRYVLRTKNLPILTNLRHWTKQFESPFKSEVYFVSTRLRIGQTFGTPQPVIVRDQELGAVRVRAFGVYSFRIADAARFHRQVSGTRDAYRVADLEGQLRGVLVSALGTELGAGTKPFLDLAANQPELAEAVRVRADAECAELGIAITDVQLESLNLPDELQQRLDERTGMTMVGDLGRYTQFQTARSIPLAAAAEGGAAGAGVGVGAGVAMGQAMAQTIGAAAANAPQSGAAASPPKTGAAGAAPVACPSCHAALAHATRFCPECGHSLG